MLAPGSIGLFSRAIAQSGAFVGGLALRPKTSEEEARKGLELAKILGCQHNDTNEILKCLQSLPANSIMSVPFLPRGSIDGALDTVNPMLPGTTYESDL